MLLSRGSDIPMLVILLGALGGMVMSGIVGLFVGVNYKQTFYRSWYGFLLTLAGISGSFSFFEGYDLSLVTLIALLFFLLSHTYAALKQVMLTDYVSRNQIVGSVCVFLESLTGSFYLAIMVASLVSSRLNQSDNHR